jgi:hypothetical protein
MTTRKVQVERRKNKRFRVEQGAYAVCKTSYTGTGRLIDISLDGLRFNFSSVQEPSMAPTELVINASHGRFRLFGIPCKPIWHFITIEVPTTCLHLMQCGMEFGRLTPQQASKVEYFIQNHTIGEV